MSCGTASHPNKVTGTEKQTLADLASGEEARVVNVRNSGTVGKRLMEMGVVPGVLVRVVKAAPFGDPIEVRLRGYSLALRLEEARAIEVAE
jgi:ferrous iron transport protein A